MLFSDFDQSYTAMHQHPMTTVIERVRSVTKLDPKHMCKACNAHKLCYHGDILTVYVLRHFGQRMHEITRHPFFILHMSVMMNVASFIIETDHVKLQRFRARRDSAREENSEVQ